MKINGPGQPPAPDAAAAADKAAKREGAAATGEAPSSGKMFSEKLAGITAGSKTGAPQTAGPAGARAVPVGDVAAELRAGKLTPQTAVDKVIERVLARQLGPDAPPGVRDRVRVALQDALESDATLADKLTQLG